MSLPPRQRRSALKKIIVAKKTFTGGVGQADRWGNVQVTMVVKKTTTITGGKKTVKRHIDVDQGADLPGPHRSLAVHQPERAPAC